MKKLILSTIIVTSFQYFFPGCAIFKPTVKEERIPTREERIKEFKDAVRTNTFAFEVPPYSKVDTVIVDTLMRKVEIGFNREFSHIPFRNENVKVMYSSINEFFKLQFNGYTYTIKTLKVPIEQLIPNFYRSDTSQFDRNRMPRTIAPRPKTVIQNISKLYVPTQGLFDKNIGVWHSHGWYYNLKEERWEWQRPRLFQTVEDEIPMTFVLPYLAPMLENAGANVFIPRERDLQTNEVIVDNDAPAKSYLESSDKKSYGWKTSETPGFAYGTPPYENNFNPFLQGTSRFTLSDTVATARITYLPTIPETGEYAIYISYASSDSNITDAQYIVFHAGGRTEFKVNQTIGGSTWMYIGTFRFKAGTNPEIGRVVLTNKSAEAGKRVSADAIRFGGGMGLVARNRTTSGRPKYLEGSRYFLQYAGMPDSLVFNFNRNILDYNDDYQSRAEYLNYLKGAPYGPNRNRKAKGLGVPIDLSLSFHTDAGITKNDTTVGTLLIYNLVGSDSAYVFPDSVSRLANRDFADIMLTQIVDDLRGRYDNIWNSRQIRNADYSECTRPNMPGVLLELLSHQNFLDMKFMLDPRFRFDVSRSIYKSMTKFLSFQNQVPYTVQPLPPIHFAAEFSGERNVTLTWKPQNDPLEPTAVSTQYIIYTRVDDNGFDNGVMTDKPTITFDNLKHGVIYSYKVAAVNDGGESFPSEILSVCQLGNDKDPVLIVNGFERVCGPLSFETPTHAGFLNIVDAGVPDRYQPNFVGLQYDFERSSYFRSNDAPGHGASFSDFETSVIAGNTFDFPYIHGKALKDCGYSFVSTSVKAVQDSIVVLNNYKFVDLILGEQKETRWQKSYADSIIGTQFKAFPTKLREAIEQYCKNGGNIFISGAYVGTDLYSGMPNDSLGFKFASNTLKFNWITGHASRIGSIVSVNDTFLTKGTGFTFNTVPSKDIYAVESPDELRPIEGGRMLLRYAQNQFGAAIGYKQEYGIVVFGFPFETILGESARNSVMKAVLMYLKM